MAKRNNPRMSRKTRNFWRSAGLVFLSVTLSFVLLGIFGEGISNPFKGDVNTANLLKEEAYIDNYDSLDETDHGMHVKWYDDGSFALYGKHDDPALNENQLYEYQFVQVDCTAGTQYVLSANNDKADKDTFGLYAVVDGTTVYTQKGEVKFTPSEDQVVVIGWYVKNEHTIIWQKIEPTLVAGDKAIEFYK